MLASACFRVKIKHNGSHHNKALMNTQATQQASEVAKKAGTDQHNGKSWADKTPDESLLHRQPAAAHTSNQNCQHNRVAMAKTATPPQHHYLLSVAANDRVITQLGCSP